MHASFLLGNFISGLVGFEVAMEGTSEGIYTA